MSAIQRNILSVLAVALMLTAIMVSGAPAAAQSTSPRGIWVDLRNDSASRSWTLTVINLTNYSLSLVTNSVDPSGNQQPPFFGNTFNEENAFPLVPYRNATWQSNTSTVAYPHPYWNGTLTFLPQEDPANPGKGMDPKWTVTLNFDPYNSPQATWVYLTADFTANPDWWDVAPYNISCSYPGSYNAVYNVMTLSGKDLVVTWYAPNINNLNSQSNPRALDATLVFRQRWPHEPYKNGYQDSLTAPCLTYQDNDGSW